MKSSLVEISSTGKILNFQLIFFIFFIFANKTGWFIKNTAKNVYHVTRHPSNF
jgi:hypothetical protein